MSPRTESCIRNASDPTWPAPGPSTPLSGRGRTGRKPFLVANAIQVLLSPDEDLSLADCWRGVAVFAQRVLGHDLRLFARVDELGDAVIGQEMHQALGRHQRGAVVLAQPGSPV